VASLLEETEEEEKAADGKLNDVAMSLYEEADTAAESEEEEEQEERPARKPAASPRGASMRSQKM